MNDTVLDTVLDTALQHPHQHFQPVLMKKGPSL